MCKVEKSSLIVSKEWSLSIGKVKLGRNIDHDCWNDMSDAYASVVFSCTVTSHCFYHNTGIPGLHMLPCSQVPFLSSHVVFQVFTPKIKLSVNDLIMISEKHDIWCYMIILLPHFAIFRNHDQLFCTWVSTAIYWVFSMNKLQSWDMWRYRITCN